MYDDIFLIEITSQMTIIGIKIFIKLVHYLSHLLNFTI